MAWAVPSRIEIGRLMRSISKAKLHPQRLYNLLRLQTLPTHFPPGDTTISLSSFKKKSRMDGVSSTTMPGPPQGLELILRGLEGFGHFACHSLSVSFIFLPASMFKFSLLQRYSQSHEHWLSSFLKKDILVALKKDPWLSWWSISRVEDNVLPAWALLRLDIVTL